MVSSYISIFTILNGLIYLCTQWFSKLISVDMYELLEFQPSLLIFCLAECFIVVYTWNYYMVLLHIILRWGGVIGPNSEIAQMRCRSCTMSI